MRPWRERNPELAALFNPAFCGLILHAGVSHYQKLDQRGMPFPIAYLILPCILSSSIRGTLPSTARTPFHLWLDREPQVKIRLANRAANLSPITREALLFLIQRQRLILSGDRIQRSKLIKGVTKLGNDVSELTEL